MMKAFNRQYFCRSDDDDSLSIRSFGDDSLIRFGCTWPGDSSQEEVFVNLNRDQVDNLATLLRDWHDALPDVEPLSVLWKDVVGRS